MSGRHGVWAAGLVVAVGAGAATAHGLYEVAAAAGVPAPIAWLYPLITDGLALVAYAAAARLTGAGRGHAWAVVVLAAGLSGVAQATYLAGAVRPAPVALRFGGGAWPALAAAIVAHLLHLLGRTESAPEPVAVPAPAPPVRTDEPAPAAVPTPERGQARRGSRGDAELLAALAELPDPISVRATARELGCGFERARRLLTTAGRLPNHPDLPEDPDPRTDR
jgi:hypothetical protein